MDFTNSQGSQIQGSRIDIHIVVTIRSKSQPMDVQVEDFFLINYNNLLDIVSY